MKYFVMFVLVALSFSTYAQKKSTVKNVNAHSTMSPAELEAYKKKMVQQSIAGNEKFATQQLLNSIPLPDSKIEKPVLQVQKLAMIPVKPLTRAEFVTRLETSIKEVKQTIPPAKVDEVQIKVESIPEENLHPEAIMEFYNRDPQKGMLMMMMLTKKNPESGNLLNNLGAIYNMVGAQQKAIPCLQFALEKYPRSVSLLGNIGQSFFGLGDLNRAKEYFQKCLDIDSMHVEANHSMGMIHYFNNEFDKAMCFFEREGCATLRSSALGMDKRMGKKFNLRDIAKKARAMKGLPNIDYLSVITQNKFKLPEFPLSVKAVNMNLHDYAQMAASYQAEQQFWMQKALQVSANYGQYADEMPGIYHEQVKAMLHYLDDEFTPEYLHNFSDQDFNALQEIIAIGTAQLNRIRCSEAPQGSSIELQEAYAVKCCEESLRPIADALLSQIGDMVSNHYEVGQQRWKDYLNEMVAIAELDPSPGNQMMVYNTIAGYFAYLSTGMQFYTSEINSFLPKCVERYDPNHILRLIQSERNWKIDCPTGLNIQAEIMSVALKVDCNKVAIEAGATISGTFELDLKTHQSTITIGPGFAGDVLGVVNGETKNHLYLSFDKYMHYQDFGLKNSTELEISGNPIPIIADKISIGGNLSGIEVSNKISIHSGASPLEVEWKGVAASYVQWLNSK